MSDTFVDLGSGWFFAQEHGDGQTYVADANASDPDHVFGPAAWNGRRGPGSGRTLVRLHYVELDAYRAALDARCYDDAPDPGECPLWPARTEVTEAGARAGLDALAPLYECEATFLNAVREFTRAPETAPMHTTDLRERLAAAKDRLAGCTRFN